MRRTVVLLFAVGLAACDALPGKPDPADRPLRPTEVTDVDQLYRENCAGCHGDDGVLGPALPLDHPVYLAVIDPASFRRIVAEGVADTAMPPFVRSAGGMLTDAQVDILATGIRQRWGRADALGGATPPPWAGDGSGDAQRGVAVYATFCARCHGPAGAGGTAGSIVDGSYLALVSAQNLRTLVITGRPDLGHPDWRSYVEGQSMTAQQVSDVVAWLVSQRSALPGRPYAQGGTP
ncbi:MAG TPA: c-type cytochrome [Candidatus Binatia bacterium]|jgi:mono/diheme cytochrome c family protein|nr:c-type cytochrome [Candidatus Binatia bacterium]